METFDGNIENFDNRFAGDQGVHARFYLFPVTNEAKSSEAGRPIYDEREFVEIVASGNANNIVRRKATQEDKMRFRRQYEMFSANSDSEQLTGTPLSEVTWLNRGQVEELLYFKIRTLEGLANMSDDSCSKHVGLYDLKRKAKTALEASEASAPVTKLAAENDQLRNDLAALKNVVEEQTKLLAQMQKEKIPAK